MLPPSSPRLSAEGFSIAPQPRCVIANTLPKNASLDKPVKRRKAKSAYQALATHPDKPAFRDDHLGVVRACSLSSEGDELTSAGTARRSPSCPPS